MYYPLQRGIHSSVVFELEYHVMEDNSMINLLVTWCKSSFLIRQFTVEVYIIDHIIPYHTICMICNISNAIYNVPYKNSMFLKSSRVYMYVTYIDRSE